MEHKQQAVGEDLPIDPVNFVIYIQQGSNPPQYMARANPNNPNADDTMVLSGDVATPQRFSVDTNGTYAIEASSAERGYLSIIKGASAEPPYALQLLHDLNTPDRIPIFGVPADGVESIIDPTTGHEIAAEAMPDGSIVFKETIRIDDVPVWLYRE